MIYISMGEMRRRALSGVLFHELELRPRGSSVPSNAIHDWLGVNGQGSYAAICLTDYQSEHLDRHYWVFYFTDANSAFEVKLLWG